MSLSSSDVQTYLWECFRQIQLQLELFLKEPATEPLEIGYLHARSMHQFVQLANVPDCVDQAIKILCQEFRKSVQASTTALRHLPQQQPSFGPGRPKYVISKDQLSFLLEMNFTVPQIASMLSVSTRTIKYRLQEYDMRVSDFRTVIADEDLQDRIAAVIHGNSQLGERMITGSIVSQGVRVSRARIRQCIANVRMMLGTNGATLRSIRRRVYNVTAPMNLWHQDGYHKLIRWRVVIHGCVDGFTRLIVFLQGSDNNRSDTVLSYFKQAVRIYGLPQCVRSDLGGENVGVASFMLETRGPERMPFLTGRSVHNQRIERSWKDLHEGLICVYQTALFALEESTGMNPSDDVDCWCLHFVLLPLLNRSLAAYTEMWNSHKIRTQSMSPIQLFISGMQHQSTSAAAREHFGDTGRSWDYGIDWEELPEEIDENEDETVIVPSTTCGLSHDQLRQLASLVDVNDVTLDNIEEQYSRTRAFVSRIAGY